MDDLYETSKSHSDVKLFKYPTTTRLVHFLLLPVLRTLCAMRCIWKCVDISLRRTYIAVMSLQKTTHASPHKTLASIEPKHIIKLSTPMIFTLLNCPAATLLLYIHIMRRQ